MPADVNLARTFLYDNARLLERRLARLLFDDADADDHAAAGDASTAAVLAALGAYRNADGGWGHALEPDLRGPDSQVSAAMSALEVLARIGAVGHPWISETCDWLSAHTLPDGSVPQVLPSAADFPAAPWMRPNDSGFLTFAIVAHLRRLRADHPWLATASEWCWQQIDRGGLAGYQAVFALTFLDAVPDVSRATEAVERFRDSLDERGNIPISGGVEGEHVTPLTLSPRPGTPSRELFTDEMIERELARLESEQLEDGGWDFQFLHWSLGQVTDWRGIVTLDALETLRRHGRLPAV